MTIRPSLPLWRVKPVAKEILRELLSLAVVKAGRIVGSARRWSPTVGDIDLVCAIDPTEKNASVQFREIQRKFYSLGNPLKFPGTDPDKLFIVVEVEDFNVRVDLNVSALKNYVSVTRYNTGSTQHNVELRRKYANANMTLSPYGIFKHGKKIDGNLSEKEVYHRVDLPWHPPEIRDEGLLKDVPRLLKDSDLKTSFSSATIWANPHSLTLPESVASIARARNLELVFCDDIRKLRGNLYNYLADITRIKLRYGPWLKVVAGIKATVETSGKVCVPDDARNDFIMVCDSSNARIAEAITNDLRIKVIADPQPDKDWGLLVSTAAMHQVALELTGDPETSFTLNLVKEARDLGCRFFIRTTGAKAKYGVKIARKALIGPKQFVTVEDLKI